MFQLMDRIGSSGKGIRAFLSPKSAEEVEKGREHERRRHAEAAAKQQKEREEREAIELLNPSLLKEVGKTADSSGRAMKKARAASKAKSK